MTNRRLAFLVSTVIVAGCGDKSSGPDPAPPFEPTDPMLLSTGSPTKDEDPSVLRAQDGSILVAWFSDRGGNSDLYVTRTRNGTQWDPAARATTHADRDFYPTLIQTGDGMFHLFWFRWDDAFRSHILSNTSVDGLTWSGASEVQVTSDPDLDDWVPTVVEGVDGTLFVYFVSEVRDASNPTSEIFVTTLRPGESVWDAPAPVTAINDATMHDHLPSAARVGDQIVLVWMRYDTSVSLPWLTSKSDLYVSTSLDGLSWTSPTKVTNDTADVVHIFPAFASTLEGGSSIVWLSTRLGPPRVFEIGFDEIDSYPSSAVELAALPQGYSHRVAATPTPGVRMGTWVQGPEGAQDIHVRCFTAP